MTTQEAFDDLRTKLRELFLAIADQLHLEPIVAWLNNKLERK
jgi:hypothetical protein